MADPRTLDDAQSRPPQSLEEQVTFLMARLKENDEKLARIEEENAELKKQVNTGPKSTLLHKRKARQFGGGTSTQGRTLDFGTPPDSSEEENENDMKGDRTTNIRGRRESKGMKDTRSYVPKWNTDERSYMSGINERHEKQLAEMKELVLKVAGTKAPLLRESTTRYSDEPFASWISETRMPKRFTMPHCKPYDGTADPEDHVASYKHRMGTCNISPENLEAVMCKGFSSTLTGTAQRWYSSLPHESIRSFSELVTKFVQHFSDSRKKEKDETDLYDLEQGRNETLKQYIRRFKDVKMAIPDCRDKNAINAFIKGLIPDTGFHINLKTIKPKTFEEVLERAEGQLEYEEDLASRKGKQRRREERNQDSKKGWNDRTNRWSPSYSVERPSRGEYRRSHERGYLTNHEPNPLNAFKKEIVVDMGS